MTRRLHSVFLFAAIATTCCSISAFACGDKATSASNTPAGKSAAVASNGACTAEMAAKCTPEMAAACKASGASMTSCPAHGKTKTSAATASSAKSAAASADCCAMKGAKTAAVTASAKGSCTSGAAAVVAGTGSSCSSHKTTDAVTTGGQSCGSKGAMAGHECDACGDMAACESELKSAGSQFQVVPLKNGVMYVYTATDAKNVRTVQSAVARRTQRMNALVNANNAKLCPECKTMRGAMASGKLTREIVNIEGGSISLVTSSDPSMVAKLYSMAGLSQQKLVKS